VTALSERPDIVTKVWQPIPAARQGALGDGGRPLCGQPLQKYAAR